VEVSGDFANFRAVYDGLTGEVMRSHVQFLGYHLGNWFRALDSTSEVAPIIKNLQIGLDFAKWHAETEAGSHGIGGSLSWPKDPKERLGMQLLLFRSAVEKGNGDIIAGYGWRFIPSSDRNFNNSARRFIDQVFRPMAAELRRYLEKQMMAVPAADRVVKLDHNSPPYHDLLTALERLEEALRSSNEYEDGEEKEQRIAEVSASRRLLNAPRVALAALTALLRPVVVQFTTKVKDSLITTAAALTSAAILAWLGTHLF
jgi:hypothetical protein